MVPPMQGRVRSIEQVDNVKTIKLVVLKLLVVLHITILVISNNMLF